MPYIDPKRRAKYVLPTPDTAGDLAYCISQLIRNYSKGVETSYAFHATVVGVLETLKGEYERLFLHPYEDHKRVTNGDVWTTA
jgi:hypothetical protein